MMTLLVVLLVLLLVGVIPAGRAWGAPGYSIPLILVVLLLVLLLYGLPQ